ncbi:MAG: 3-keto-5-aminohexanoate cleavage protein [Alphaproteobacteria bacterium]|nr:3-keto-5-aminohexanoate cleavage protein [Alphaproteobacteria bacterium]
MARPIIISCAITGGSDTKHMNPAVPVTPEEIANEVISAHNVGASIAHIHVRDPKTAKRSMDPKLYKEVVDRLRDAGCPILINLTTGPGGILAVEPDAPHNFISGSILSSAEERVQHIYENQPDLCTLDVTTMNYSDVAVTNTKAMLEKMAGLIQRIGVKIEMEVFDTGQLWQASDMCNRGIITDPNPLFQLCLGIPWGGRATMESMQLMRDQLPSNAKWAAFGISRLEFPMVAAAVVLGGHVRVGMEDNLYLSRGVLTPGNTPLVERAVKIIEAIGEYPASVKEAREILGLEKLKAAVL